MTENEASMIMKDLENINRRMDKIDDRLDKFIQAAANIQNIENEQVRNRDSLERAFKEITRLDKALVDREKIENAIKKIDDLMLEPVKKNDQIVKTTKGWIITAIGVVVVGGISAFITWVISSFIKR